MKKNKKWIAATTVCLIMCVCFALGMIYYTGKTEGIEDAGISTGARNNALTFDHNTGILFVGTHDNHLAAFRDQEEIWHVEATGSFSDLVYNENTNLLYAGNEDGHIYVYQAQTGELTQEINVQRRILAIDTSKDGSFIAAATSTGSSKANVMIYTADGQELYNNKYKVKVSGISYCSDDETLLIANNRGEVAHITQDGQELEVYSTNYSILQMIKGNGTYWTVCKDGSYHCFNDDLELLRTGKITNSMQAVISSIGVDEDEEHVFIGTEEGYLFAMDGHDREIYSANLGYRVSDFTADKKKVYVTGLADSIKIIYADNLENINLNIKVRDGMRIALLVSGILLMISVIMVIPYTQKKVLVLLKNIWKHRMAYIMLAPTFVLIWFFNYRGIITAFIRAFTDWSTTNDTLAKMNFVGLDNFRKMVTEGYFLIGMRNLVILMVTSILKILTVPLLVAWMVYSSKGDKRKYLHRFLFVLPIVVPGVISAMTWQKIYDPSIGLLNQILGQIGLSSWQHVWLGDAKTAIWAIVFMGFPFIGAMGFLVYYGGLLNIGNDVVESAQIDGGTRWDIFWKIQLPLIRPQISVMVMLQIIGTMQDFNSIYILTGGGPGTSTYVPALELYLNVAQFGRYGYACALGVVLFVFTMTATLISNCLTKDRG